MVSTKYTAGGNEQKEEEQKCVIREHWRNLNLIYSSNEGGKLPMWKGVEWADYWRAKGQRVKETYQQGLKKEGAKGFILWINPDLFWP
jgi:hypothetical protein